MTRVEGVEVTLFDSYSTTSACFSAGVSAAYSLAYCSWTSISERVSPALRPMVRVRLGRKSGGIVLTGIELRAHLTCPCIPGIGFVPLLDVGSPVEHLVENPMGAVTEAFP